MAFDPKTLSTGMAEEGPSLAKVKGLLQQAMDMLTEMGEGEAVEETAAPSPGLPPPGLNPRPPLGLNKKPIA